MIELSSKGVNYPLLCECVISVWRLLCPAPYLSPCERFVLTDSRQQALLPLSTFTLWNVRQSCTLSLWQLLLMLLKLLLCKPKVEGVVCVYDHHIHLLHTHIYTYWLLRSLFLFSLHPPHPHLEHWVSEIFDAGVCVAQRLLLKYASPGRCVAAQWSG